MDEAEHGTSRLNPEQRRQLAARYDLSVAELDKLLEDLWLLTDETPTDYARRRHAELRAAGLANEGSFELIRSEIAAGRFASPALSVRQIRRIIYG